MKKIFRTIFALTLLLCLLTGCTIPQSPVTDAPPEPPESTQPQSTVNESLGDSDMFSARDLRGEPDADSIRILFDGDSVVCGSPAVTVAGTVVTISSKGSYTLSGSTTDGCVVVDVPDGDKVQLVLDSISLHCSTSSAIQIQNADKVFITLPDGSNSTIESAEGNAIHSASDLTLNGSGSAAMNASVGHGITCKDDLVITGGNYSISAASHGLDANDSIRIKSATLDIHAGKDAMHAENNESSTLGYVYISGGDFDLEAAGDGISAGNYLHIKSGGFHILTGGGYENGDQDTSDNWGDFIGGGGRPPRPRSTNSLSITEEDSSSIKGLKAGSSILLSGGEFDINSADDTIHSTVVEIRAGSYTLSSGDDAIHADDNLVISDCSMEIKESYEGLEAQHLTVSGGSIRLNAKDDGMNAAGGNDSSGTSGRDPMFGENRPGGRFGTSGGSITISGGSLDITASGDGIDSNGTLLITGGSVSVCGPVTGDTAILDYDVSGEINGGTFVGTGSSMMAQSLSSSTQGVIAVNAGNVPAGTTITLQDSEGNEIIAHSPALPYSVVILSSPDIVKGKAYQLMIGEQSATFEAN